MRISSMMMQRTQYIIHFSHIRKNTQLIALMDTITPSQNISTRSNERIYHPIPTKNMITTTKNNEIESKIIIQFNVI